MPVCIYTSPVFFFSAANCQEDSTPIVETASTTSSAIFNDATIARYAGESVTQPGENTDSLGNDRLGVADNFTTLFDEGKSSNATETLLGDTTTEIKNPTDVKVTNSIGLTTETIASINKDEDIIDELTSDYVYADQDIRYPAFTHSPPIVTTSGITTSKQEDLDDYIYGEQLSKDEEITEETSSTSISNLPSKEESGSDMDNKDSEDVTTSKEQIQDSIGKDGTTSSNEESSLVEMMTSTPYILLFETTPTNKGFEQINEESTIISKITTFKQDEIDLQDSKDEETYTSSTTVTNPPKDEPSTVQHHSKQSESVTMNEETASDIESNFTTTPYILPFKSTTNIEETTTTKTTIQESNFAEIEQDTTLVNSNDPTTQTSSLEEDSSDLIFKQTEHVIKETTTSTALADSNEEKSFQKRYTADSSSILTTESLSQTTLVDIKEESTYASTNVPFSLDVEESIITIPPSVFEQIHANKVVFDDEGSLNPPTTKLYGIFQTDDVISSTMAEDNLNKDTIQDLDDVEVFDGDNSIEYENIVLLTTTQADAFSTNLHSTIPMTNFSLAEEDITTLLPALIGEEIQNFTEGISSITQSTITSPYEENRTNGNDANPLIDIANDTTAAVFETTFTSSINTEANISPLVILTSTINDNDETIPYSTITEEILNIVSTTSSPSIVDSQSGTLKKDNNIYVTEEGITEITENNNYIETSTVLSVTPLKEDEQANLFEQFTEDISTEKPLNLDLNFSRDYETTLPEDSTIETTTTIIDVWLAEQNLTRTTIEEDSSTGSTTAESVKDEIFGATEENLIINLKTHSIEEATEIIDGITNSIATSLNVDTTTVLYEGNHQTTDSHKMIFKPIRKEKMLDLQGTTTDLSTAAYLEGVTTESNDLDLDDENLTSTIFSKELVDNGQFTADAINILKETTDEITENVYEDNLESNQDIEDPVMTTPILESDEDFASTTIENNFDISTEHVVYTMTMRTKSIEFSTFNQFEEENAEDEQNATEVTLTTIHAKFFESYQHRNNETTEDEHLPNKEVILLPEITSTEVHEEIETIGSISTQNESTTTTDNIISSKKELEELDSQNVINQTSTTSKIFDDTTTTSDNLNVEDNREAFIESKINIPVTPAYDEQKLIIFTKYLEEKTTEFTPSEQSVDLLTQKSIMDILRGENVDIEEHSLTDRETKENLTSLDMQNWQKLSLNELQEVAEDNIDEEESDESDGAIKTLEEELLNGAVNRNDSLIYPVSTSYFDEDYTNSEEFNSSEVIHHPDNQNNTPYLFIVPNKDGCLRGNISLKFFVGVLIFFNILIG